MFIQWDISRAWNCGSSYDWCIISWLIGVGFGHRVYSRRQRARCNFDAGRCSCCCCWPLGGLLELMCVVVVLLLVMLCCNFSLLINVASLCCTHIKHQMITATDLHKIDAPSISAIDFYPVPHYVHRWITIITWSWVPLVTGRRIIARRGI